MRRCRKALRTPRPPQMQNTHPITANALTMPPKPNLTYSHPALNSAATISGDNAAPKAMANDTRPTMSIEIERNGSKMTPTV